MLAARYDDLNLMMDELDAHYQHLVANQTGKDVVERTKQLLIVGDYVATLWIDNMWYRGRVSKIINHDTVEIFYIDYGTTMKIKKHDLFTLDPKFHKFPAQAILAELAGIEPLIDEARTLRWSQYTTR